MGEILHQSLSFIYYWRKISKIHEKYYIRVCLSFIIDEKYQKYRRNITSEFVFHLLLAKNITNIREILHPSFSIIYYWPKIYEKYYIRVFLSFIIGEKYKKYTRYITSKFVFHLLLTKNIKNIGEILHQTLSFIYYWRKISKI